MANEITTTVRLRIKVKTLEKAGYQFHKVFINGKKYPRNSRGFLGGSLTDAIDKAVFSFLQDQAAFSAACKGRYKG